MEIFAKFYLNLCCLGIIFKGIFNCYYEVYVGFNIINFEG